MINPPTFYVCFKEYLGIENKNDEYSIVLMADCMKADPEIIEDIIIYMIDDKGYSESSIDEYLSLIKEMSKEEHGQEWINLYKLHGVEL